MSASGTSRRFAAMQQHVGYRGQSGLRRGVNPADLWVHGLDKKENGETETPARKWLPLPFSLSGWPSPGHRIDVPA